MTKHGSQNKNPTPRPPERILIANRGEIALRIIRSCRELGLESVAVYSDADADSRHRRAADYAVRLPGELASDTYLQIPRLVNAAVKSGADAVHPGYGFLSESSAFARAVQEAGLVFVGPSPESMDRLGNKVRAKTLMTERGVPTVPGSEGALETLDSLEALVSEIGFPIILKAAAGGGGRGMRVVREKSGLREAYDSCRREAESYFGDPQIFCERYIDHPRHIEVQVLCDGTGHGVHLFERDCSIQRRHQKLIEEAPSLYLSEEQRARVGEIAVTAAQAAGYRSAGTVEFICESPERPYFMEMNTRIQVEHPVSEMITGIDLVAWQLRVARGEELPWTQEEISHRGWAIETRINAEDPERDFAPAPGRITDCRWPEGPFVRVDTHLEPGAKIPPHYDSMVAKLIVWGENRDSAIRRMQRALGECRVQGVPTTAKFHEVLLSHPRFRNGDFSTRFLEEEADAVAASLKTGPTSESEDPASDDRDGWAAVLAALAVAQAEGAKPPPVTENKPAWRRAAREEATE